jgi:hypothetical protein
MSGPTGPQGLQGLRGLQGDPAPASQTGPGYGYTTARITVVTPSSSPIYLTPQNLGTYFNITSNAVAIDQLTVSFPFYNPTYTNNTQATLTTAVGNGTSILYTSGTTPHLLQVNSVVTITSVTGFAAANVTNGTVSTVPSSTTFTIASATSGSGTGGTFSNTIARETTNEAYPTPEQVGSFWALKNNCKFTVYVTFSNGTVKYQGTTGVTSLAIDSGNAASLMYTAANDFTVL